MNIQNTISYKSTYYKYNEIGERSGAPAIKVYYKFPISKDVFEGILDANNLSFELMCIGSYKDVIKLEADFKYPIAGIFNRIYNTNKFQSETEKYFEKEKKIAYAFKNSIWDILGEIDEYDGMTFEDFKIVIKNKKHSIKKRDNELDLLKADLKKTKNDLYEWGDRKDTRLFINLLISFLVFLSYFILNFSFKTIFYLIIIYNIIFKIWSSFKKNSYQKNIKELENKISNLN